MALGLVEEPDQVDAKHGIAVEHEGFVAMDEVKGFFIPPPVPVDSTIGDLCFVVLANSSAADDTKGKTVDEPTMRIWSLASDSVGIKHKTASIIILFINHPCFLGFVGILYIDFVMSNEKLTQPQVFSHSQELPIVLIQGRIVNYELPAVQRHDSWTD